MKKGRGRAKKGAAAKDKKETTKKEKKEDPEHKYPTRGKKAKSS